jgi:antitoxin component of RelBE/YafQ-DinJ toxin-antitoxin module
MQSHDVWEVEDVEEITEEVQKVMKSMGLTTEEVERMVPPKKNRTGGRNGSKIK